MLDCLPPIAFEIRPPPVVWRVETGAPSRARTAAEVLRYEQETFGRSHGISAAFLAVLAARPAAALLWVFFSRAEASAFAGGRALRLDIPAHVIAGDDRGGFLLFFPDTIISESAMTHDPTISAREEAVPGDMPNPATLDERQRDVVAAIAAMRSSLHESAGNDEEREAHKSESKRHDAMQLDIAEGKTGETDPDALKAQSLAVSYSYAAYLAGAIAGNAERHGAAGVQAEYSALADHYAAAHFELEQERRMSAAGLGAGEATCPIPPTRSMD